MTPGLLALCLWTAAPAAPAAARAPEDCEGLYYGEGVARDYKRALVCFRAQDNWLMVAVMQLNGDGTPVDVAGARKSLEADEARMPVYDGKRVTTADQNNLDKIIKRREANPKATGPRIDFCNDVAGTTPNVDWCQSRELVDENAAKEARLKELRTRFAKTTWPAFDKLEAAFEAFAKAEATRAYQEYIDGTIHNSFSMSQEKLVRDHFVALVSRLSGDTAAVPTAPRSFVDADAELNVVYRDLVRSTAGGWEQVAAKLDDKRLAETDRRYAEDYRKAARAAQREWIRYRDAAGKLAAARWPGAPGVEDVARALVTGDRIRELQNSVKP